MALDLDGLERLAKAATPGPWVAGWWVGQAASQCDCALEGELVATTRSRDSPDWGDIHHHASFLHASGREVSVAKPTGFCEDAGIVLEGRGDAGFRRPEDAAFVAACDPGTILALVAHVRAVEGARAATLEVGQHLVADRDEWRKVAEGLAARLAERPCCNDC